MVSIDNLSPEDLLVLTNAVAIVLMKDKKADEINVLGNFVVGVGCLLLTVAAQQQFLQTLQENNNAENNNAANNNTTNNNVKNNSSKK